MQNEKTKGWVSFVLLMPSVSLPLQTHILPLGTDNWLGKFQGIWGTVVRDCRVLGRRELRGCDDMEFAL